MKNVFAAFIGLLITSCCMAEGWSSLGGKNNVGDIISVYPAWDSWEVASGTVSYPDTDHNLYYVDVYNLKTNPEKPIRYNDLRCEFRGSNPNEPSEFSCKKSGKSPLSGATYKIAPNTNPKDCSYRAMFICTSGCNVACPQFDGHQVKLTEPAFRSQSG